MSDRDLSLTITNANKKGPRLHPRSKPEPSKYRARTQNRPRTRRRQSVTRLGRHRKSPTAPSAPSLPYPVLSEYNRCRLRRSVFNWTSKNSSKEQIGSGHSNVAEMCQRPKEPSLLDLRIIPHLDTFRQQENGQGNLDNWAKNGVAMFCP
jgi:hypothetical protein